MSFHINGKTLYEKIRYLAPIARKGNQPHHRNVRLRCPTPTKIELAVVGDMLTIRTYAEIVRGEGFNDDAFIDGDVLYKMSQKLKKQDVGFELLHDSHDLELTAGNITTTFPAAEGRHPGDTVPGEHAFTMPAALFDDAMSEALPYASTDSARPKLCGVFVDSPDGDEPNITATDGHRLYNRRFGEEWGAALNDNGILIPDHAVKCALKLVDARAAASPVTVSFDDETIVIEQKGVFRIDTDVVEGHYPDFRQCLPSTSGSEVATFDADEMQSALKMSAPFLGKSGSVRVIYNGSVQVQIDGDVGQFDADLCGTYGGASAVRLAFNAKYLSQVCGTIGGEVRQYVADVFEPQLFVGCDDQDEQTRVIVMPMRV